MAEKRGKKDKKKLEINPLEAEIVRRIFKLYVHGENGNGPLGLKAIATLLNAEGITTRKGSRFLLQYVHKILTNEAYVTRHVFNRRDRKTGRLKPEEEWITLKTPRIISDVEFNAVRDRLEHNHPLRTAPRIVNSDILLTGLTHCSSCQAPMRIQTGKSGAYRYYKCGQRADAGNTVCNGCSLRMEKLDDLVLNAVLDRTLAPERLKELLTPLVERAHDTQKQQQERMKQLRSDRRNLKTQLDALWRQIATEDIKLDASLKGYIEKLQNQYEAIIRSISRLEYQNSPSLKDFNSEQTRSFTNALRTRLTSRG